ncbi:MAG: hypothetical protein PHX09_01930 [Clostridia bacterium]|nr:hypothetical protein [Clostridia bacterium]MDD4685945.1 hypothetical protein [Clostridia bacterium]
MDNLKSQSRNDNECLKTIRNFKEAFDNKIESLSKIQRINFYARLDDRAKMIANQYGLEIKSIKEDK